MCDCGIGSHLGICFLHSACNLCLVVGVGGGQQCVIVVLGHILVFVFCGFHRCHIVVPFVVFHVSWLASTRMFWLSCRIFQLLHGIHGVG